jgi:hypothetical protein
MFQPRASTKGSEYLLFFAGLFFARSRHTGRQQRELAHAATCQLASASERTHGRRWGLNEALVTSKGALVNPVGAFACHWADSEKVERMRGRQLASRCTFQRGVQCRVVSV